KGRRAEMRMLRFLPPSLGRASARTRYHDVHQPLLARLPAPSTTSRVPSPHIGSDAAVHTSLPPPTDRSTASYARSTPLDRERAVRADMLQRSGNCGVWTKTKKRRVMPAKARTCAVIGLDGALVEVEVDIGMGTGLRHRRPAGYRGQWG